MLRPSLLPNRFRALIVPVTLLIIVVLTLALRLYGLNWDQGYVFHPDERMILMVVEGRLSLPLPLDLANLLDPKVSTLNPQFFAYGSFPLYLLKLVSHLLSFIQQGFASSELRLVGRALSALFDTGTVLLVFVIARRLYDNKVGLLAATFVSLSVLNIQLSHFYTADVVLTFFIIATFYFCTRISSKFSYRDSILGGIVFGLGLGTKVSIAPLAATIVVAYGLQILRARPPGMSLPSAVGRALVGLGLMATLSFVVFAVTNPYAILDSKAFFSSITEQSDMVRRVSDLPYTRQYINTPAFWYQIDQIVRWGLGYPVGIITWAGMLFVLIIGVMRRRSAEILMLSWVVPYFLITGSFQVKFLRYMLPLVPFLCIMGSQMLFEARNWAEDMLNRRKEADSSSGLAWAQVRIPSQFDDISYAVAKGPFSGDSLSFHGTGDRLQGISRLLVRPRMIDAVIVLSILYSLFYSLAYINIYSVSHTAVQLSNWINQNVPTGSLILQEHWEEGIPNASAYQIGELPLYENDDANKLNTVMNQLQKANYIVFFSNRLYGTISRLPDRYPMTRRYYEMLFSGELGFQLVDSATSYPNLAGISFVDDTFDRPGLPTPAPLKYFFPTRYSIFNGFADESFTVYDHPKAMIFQKTNSFSANAVRAQLSDALVNRGSTAIQQKEGLLLSTSDLKADQEGGTWSEIYDRSGITNQFPMLTWLLVVEVIALFTIPLGFLLFGSFADKGFLFSKTLGILLTAWLVWLAASYHLVTYSRLSIVLGVVLIGIASTACFYWKKGEIIGFFRERWKLVAIGEAVFISAFLLFYLIRLFNPDLWHPYRGGEKPMDFAYLNAVVRTTYFPPYDPWFSGGYLNYYYFGQVIVATLIKLTGITSEIGYNLAVPLLFALTVSGVFSLVSSLVAYRIEKTKETGSKRSFVLGLPVAIGLFGAILVAVLGNLDGLAQFVEGFWQANSLPVGSNLPGVAGTINALLGAWQVISGHKALPAFDFWRSSRMMPPSNSITEFPFFTFLFADLHAHLISFPFAVLALGLATQLILKEKMGIFNGGGKQAPALGSTAKPAPMGRLVGLVRRLRQGLGRWNFGIYFSALANLVPVDALPVLVTFALVVGAMRAINSWDYPTYLALMAAILLVGEFLTRKRFDLLLLVRFVAGIAIVYLLSAVLFAPFQANYELFYSGVLPSPERTPLNQYLLIHGLFLFLTMSFIGLEWVRHFKRAGFVRATLICCRHSTNMGSFSRLQKKLVRKGDRYSYIIPYLFIVLVGVVFLLFLPGFGTVAFLSLLLASLLPLIVEEIREQQPGFIGNIFVYLLIGLAAGIGAGVELITIQGDIDRMNTVFKFYLQAWLLYGVASAYCLWQISSTLVRALHSAMDTKMQEIAVGTPKQKKTGWRTLFVAGWFGVLTFLVLSTSIYPVFATPVRVKDRFAPSPLTNNGADFMTYSVYNDTNGKIDLVWDYEGIHWLEDNVQGSPVILEAVTPLYRWGSRFSVYTGLPTVIGWDWHQKQQRWGYSWMVDARLSDVRTIYSTVDTAITLNLLKKYNVEYIIVGKTERLYYPDAGLAKFSNMVGRSLEVAYSNQELTIYRVKP